MSAPLTPLAEFARRLAGDGLNLVAAVAAEVARAHVQRPEGLPDAVRAAVLPASGRGGSLLLCGSGGRGHWEQIPAAERARAHPIESAARRTMAAALCALGPGARLLTAEETLHFDLRRLGELAGWGHLSPYLQMLIHPVYGPWISIRGVIVTPHALAASRHVAPYDPCTACARPCLDACPVGAYARGHAFLFDTCVAHRLGGATPDRHCEDACHARAACVVGREHAYGATEYRHRHRSNLPTLRSHGEPPPGRG